MHTKRLTITYVALAAALLGLFLLPFAAAATVIVAVVLAGKRRWRALAAQLIPYLMLGAGVLTFCTLNYTHYGVFALSDFSEGSFAAAMGAMMRVDTDSDKPYLSVPADARAKIYAAVPELEPLGDVPPDSRAAGEYYRAILSGHDCVALLRLCKTLHAKQNSQTASHRGVNSTELRSWRMAEEMLYGEFGFALGMPPAQVRDFLREKLGG